MKYIPEQLSFFKERFILRAPFSWDRVLEDRETIEKGDLKLTNEDFQMVSLIYKDLDIQRKNRDLLIDEVRSILRFLGYRGDFKDIEDNRISKYNLRCISMDGLLVVIVLNGGSITACGDSAYEPVTIPLSIPWILEYDKSIVTNGAVWALCCASDFAGEALIFDLEYLINRGTLVDLEQFYRYFSNNE
jgi:hypothetical protein